MKSFLVRLLFFLIPFPVYIGIVILIDPFNYFAVSDFISQDTKWLTSKNIHPQLYKLLEYRKLKSTRIILGDSRSVILNSDHIKQLTGKDIYNFSYGGGTLIEMIETFWYTTRYQKLEEVYFGINFNLYNDYEKNNHVEQAESIMQNFFTYSFNKIILTAMIQNIKKQFFRKEYTAGIPNMSKEEFWNYQINVMGKRFYQKYKHPDHFFNELVKISEYCKKNNIKLVYFMPPTHIELQQAISRYQLEQEYKVFINEISMLGQLYNFDTENEYTRNKNNFVDPFHSVNDSLIVHTIWNQK
jgi:hypothetical protein